MDKVLRPGRDEPAANLFLHASLWRGVPYQGLSDLHPICGCSVSTSIAHAYQHWATERPLPIDKAWTAVCRTAGASGGVRHSAGAAMACHQCPREHECVEGFTYLSPQAGPLRRVPSVCAVRQRGFLETSRCTTAIRAPGSCTKTGTSAPLDIPRLARPSGLMTGTAVTGDQTLILRRTQAPRSCATSIHNRPESRRRSSSEARLQ
ncbi:hypothetical protein K491DRAFT_448367 [Lophiostoma macrostomum CBS 122681]|uniref:Uncharacterized protein n=1 Tax=Lophiostoma macrostomum CBS 122681 TaxID=1314788 RepID=A0A6A6TMJ8_9PLEO|nr:hypothetical protein K491DRAFT_448367 [Lophiostoma macrostomum CBS 122681]